MSWVSNFFSLHRINIQDSFFYISFIKYFFIGLQSKSKKRLFQMLTYQFFLFFFYKWLWISKFRTIMVCFLMHKFYILHQCACVYVCIICKLWPSDNFRTYKTNEILKNMSIGYLTREKKLCWLYEYFNGHHRSGEKNPWDLKTKYR